MSRTRRRWDQPRTRLNAMSLAKELLEALDSPVSLGVYLRLEAGEFDQVATMAIDPRDYLSPASYLVDAQAIGLVSKLESLPTTIDREGEAIRKFLEAELSCHRTNEVFLGRTSEGGGHSPFPDRVASVFHRARRKIAAILGPVPNLAQLDFRFGPGAAFGVRGETAVYNKMSSVPECTFAMMPILESFLEEFPTWFPEGSQDVHLVEGSDLTFVPKNAKTHRPICIEPLLNGLYQKGVGSWMRDRLRRWGVDLRQQEINQRLASRAHAEGLSTIDFSSASDTIAYGLVLDLLPIDWVEFLDVARCPYFHKDGTWYNFAKFSSMGNAYTFELETLIFFALATSVCDEEGISYITQENLHVYGDDVIIPRDAFDLFSEVSSHAGFSINQEKSFRSGSFFESCGCDYFEGVDVRPFFIKKDLNSLGDLYYATNSVLTLVAKLEGASDGSPLNNSRVRRLRSVHAWCVGAIPRRHRLLVPYGTGDCGLAAEFAVALPRRARKGFDGWRYRAFRSRPVRKEIEQGPRGYSGYFLRNAVVEDERPELLSREVSYEPSEPLDNGSGYTIRGRSSATVRTEVQAFYWPDPPTIWGDAAVSLVNPFRK